MQNKSKKNGHDSKEPVGSTTENSSTKGTAGKPAAKKTGARLNKKSASANSDTVNNEEISEKSQRTFDKGARENTHRTVQGRRDEIAGKMSDEDIYEGGFSNIYGGHGLRGRGEQSSSDYGRYDYRGRGGQFERDQEGNSYREPHYAPRAKNYRGEERKDYYTGYYPSSRYGEERDYRERQPYYNRPDYRDRGYYNEGSPGQDYRSRNPYQREYKEYEEYERELRRRNPGSTWDNPPAGRIYGEGYRDDFGRNDIRQYSDFDNPYRQPRIGYRGHYPGEEFIPGRIYHDEGYQFEGNHEGFGRGRSADSRNHRRDEDHYYERRFRKNYY